MTGIDGAGLHIYTVADLAALAAIEFVPYELMGGLPSNAEMLNPHMVSVRIAAAVVARTKAELIAKYDFETYKEMLDSLEATKNLFEGLTELQGAASARALIVMGADAEGLCGDLDGAL